MTTPTQQPQTDQDLGTAISLPYLASKTLERRSLNFSESLWKLSKSSIVMSLLDALCNDSGAGDLKKQLLISRLQNSLDSTHFSDLDLIFSILLGFPRYLSESYSYTPTTQMLTSSQWDEVITKDARYRSRIRDFMSAIHLGGTPWGFRMMCKAVLEVDCDLFEIWKFLDSPRYQSGLHLENGGFGSSPNHASYQIVGDIGLVTTIRAVDFTPTSTQTLMSLWDEAGNQRGYRFSITSAGNLEFSWSTAGTLGTVVTKTSTVSLTTVPVSDNQKVRVAVSLDVNNGATGYDVKFWYDVGGGTLLQLGSTITTGGGATTIFASNADLVVGNTENPGTTGFVGIVYSASLHPNLTFTSPVANPNFTTQSSGVTRFTDSIGRTWNVSIAGLTLPGVSGSYASTPDNASLDIVGDIDLRADVTLNSWVTGAIQTLVAKFNTTGNQRSYRLSVNATGALEVITSVDGTATITSTSTTNPTPPTSGRLAVWVTVDVNDGSGGNTVTFYTAPSAAGPWTQLGSQVVNVGTTSIFNSTAVLEVGSSNSGTANLTTGIVHSVEVRSGIGGTLAANPDFGGQAQGVTSFTDNPGRVWTINAAALITGSAFMIPNYAFGRTGGDYRTEVVVKPHRPITRKEYRLLTIALDRLKPREVVVTISQTGVEASTQVGVDRVSADSEYFEVNLRVKGALDIASLPPPDTLTNISNWYLQAGVEIDSRSNPFSKSQEYSQVYTFTEGDIGAIDFVIYESATDPDGVRTTEGIHLSQSTPSDIFSPWKTFGLADSPDNFPGGKYGQTPTTAPALNSDGSPYVFRYASQSAFIAEQQALVLAQGGEVSGSDYRTKLTPTSSLSSKTWDPLDALFREVDLRSSSVTSSPYSSRQTTTVGI